MPALTTWCGSSCSTSTPSRRMLPFVTAHTRLSALMSVVLPAPLGPTSAKMPVSGTTRSSALTATRPPKRTVTWRASSILCRDDAARLRRRAPGDHARAEEPLESAGEEQHDQHDHAAEDRQRQAADG